MRRARQLVRCERRERDQQEAEPASDALPRSAAVCGARHRGRRAGGVELGDFRPTSARPLASRGRRVRGCHASSFLLRSAATGNQQGACPRPSGAHRRSPHGRRVVECRACGDESSPYRGGGPRRGRGYGRAKPDIVSGFAGFGASGAGGIARATRVVRNRPPLRVREHFVSRRRAAACFRGAAGQGFARRPYRRICRSCSRLSRPCATAAPSSEQHVPLAVPLSPASRGSVRPAAWRWRATTRRSQIAPPARQTSDDHRGAPAADEPRATERPAHDGAAKPPAKCTRRRVGRRCGRPKPDRHARAG